MHAHIARFFLSQATGIDEDRLRVIAPDVGGGFGGKFFYAEEVIALLAARALNRPVAWFATRSEDFLTTFHGRAIIQHLTIAATREGDATGARRPP